MQKVIIYILMFFLPVGYSVTNHKDPVLLASATSECEKLYTDMHLENIVNYAAFEQAFIGYNKVQEKNRDIITLIDFTKPSTEERLYVLDMKQKKLLYSSLVSHGRNSGENYATSFSNENGSYKSSLGFYLTESTYEGKNGYSLVLNGLERGINDRAKERAIVIHGAPYSNPSVIASGRLGRSQGCPALPQALSKPIINTIKGGTLLYIYADDHKYLAQSNILSSYTASL
ncbi:murein L,D-transpeptidase catalytic domain family protein [Dysgonomonas sp. HGC4]|uniref:murein L,D-transpeptidase catalytic domain family protein n=1 Tax=Dysgonomonas sp. HGC4 TaxID=1658009 RepID=UPI000682C09D|nr:murein L,D-transpeptidase catalytic domain family protein [Dysgonomonas sp. HGC4]MBD8347392.1 murein L,D-transpeptidase catalytic domain family protein [Dysgonomonas sp. HGC4]